MNMKDDKTSGPSDRSRKEISDAIRELKSFEDMLANDGLTVEKLDKDELVKLIEKKAVDLGKNVSHVAREVLTAGRCAGSYGCG